MKSYLRYVDDKARVAELRESIRERLAQDRLRLHPTKAHVSPVRDGLSLLGYCVYPHRRRLRNDNGYRFRRRLRRFARGYAEGRLQWQDFNPSVQSWIGHAQHADTAGLRSTMFSEAISVRGTGRERACV